MPNETDTQQIRNNESAKIQGFITGLLKGIVLNWKEIAIIVSLGAATYNHFKEGRDITISQQQQGLLWHEAHQIEQTETNNIRKER